MMTIIKIDKIDKRKNYYLTFDTETANGLDDALVYDIGGAIHDKKGNIYETFSFVVYEIFVQCKDLMKTAYYSDKIPKYQKDINQGKRKIVKFSTARKIIKALCEKYNVKAIIAHNAFFDYCSTNTTMRYITSSKNRYFLPFGIPLYDTLAMARQTIGKQKSYREWCKSNDYITANGQPRLTAEILHRYATNNEDFAEDHTGLEDVLIEVQIFVWCTRQHKKMKKTLWRD